MSSAMGSVYARVRRQGSTGTGVEHWKMQRLTAIANVFLVIWFIVVAVAMSGASHAEWYVFFGNPINAGLMIAFVVSTFWHSRLGVQVIIEDYVHHEGAKTASLVGLTLLWALLALICVVSVLMIAIGA